MKGEGRGLKSASDAIKLLLESRRNIALNTAKNFT
jgi:hypothetical protein